MSDITLVQCKRCKDWNTEEDKCAVCSVEDHVADTIVVNMNNTMKNTQRLDIKDKEVAGLQGYDIGNGVVLVVPNEILSNYLYDPNNTQGITSMRSWLENEIKETNGNVLVVPEYKGFPIKLYNK